MKNVIENLRVWHTSRELAKEINQVTSTFPALEKFGITNQLKKSSVAMSSNVASGSIQWSKASQSKHYELAFDELVVVLNKLTLATYLNYLHENQLNALRTKINQVGKMLNALSVYQLTKKATFKPVNYQHLISSTHKPFNHQPTLSTISGRSIHS
ncbi:MAG: four helix bundle protein [Mariniphaga sp.]